MSATPKPGLPYAQPAVSSDQEADPVFALARRLMERLLHDVRDKVVVDIGCGTGSDLEEVVSRGAKAVGLDFAPKMLREAAKKKSLRARLAQADARNLPLQDASADLVICSFVLNHVDNLALFAEQLAKVAVPGADVFVLDVHPETQRHGWRSALNRDIVGAPARVRELAAIQQAFDAAEFELQELAEPKLAHPEKRLFESAQRMDLYEQARHIPALCLFQFRRRTLTADRLRLHTPPRKQQRTWHLTGARVSLGPHTAVPADLVMDAMRIRGVLNHPFKRIAPRTQDEAVVDLSGLLVLPGLINAHDDLLAGWPTKLSPDVLPWLGALRNLQSGVTTVLQSGNLESVRSPDFPLRLVRNHAYSAKQDVQQIAADFANAPPDASLVIDIGWCGANTLDFIRNLDQQRLLTSRTILVGVAHLDPDAQSLLAERRTSAVWVSASGSPNFNFVLNNNLIALGADGSGTSSLRDQMRTAQKLGVPPEAIYVMVTSRASSVLRMRNGEGRIMAEAPADLVVVNDYGQTPAQALSALDYTPLAVFVGSSPVLMHDTFLLRLAEPLRTILRPLKIGETQWWTPGEPIVTAVRKANESGECRMSGEPVTA